MNTEFLSQTELETVHKARDPWGYLTNVDDERRKNYLLSELPQRKYDNVLDVGCGQGFITKCIPGRKVLGVDASAEAIKFAKEFETENVKFRQGNLFELAKILSPETYDLIIITGVLYPPYIGAASTLVYHIIDQLLQPGGILVSVHISEWYHSRFPYLMLSDFSYSYREYYHKLEVYTK